MTDIAYAGLNTTLSILETQLLTQSDYDTMLQLDSMDQVLDYLAKTAYSVPDTVKETKEFEPIISQRLVKVYQELMAATPDERILEIISLRYTYHNLKLLIKEKFMETDCQALYIPIGSYSIDNLRALIDNKGLIDELHPVIQHAVYDAVTHVEDTEDLFAVDVIMDTAYLRHIRQNAEEIGDPEVIRFVKMLIDMKNLLTFVRAVKQGQSNSFVFSALSSQGAISRSDIIDNWRTQDLSALVDSYQTAEYMIDLDKVWDQLHNNNVNPTEISDWIQKQFAEILYPYSFKAFGPMPVLTYLFFLENETDNVRLLLIGKENKLDAKLIKERMRPIYGS